MLRNKDEKLEILSAIGVLADLGPRALREVSALTTEVVLPADRVLCREGDVGREVFLIAEGTVAVSRGGEPVGVVRAGGIAGEMAVLERQPRAATLTTLTDVVALALSVREFVALVSRYPAVAAAVRDVADTRAGVLVDAR